MERRDAVIRKGLILFIRISPLSTSPIAPLEARRGQGLTFTRWKGLNLSIIILVRWYIV